MCTSELQKHFEGITLTAEQEQKVRDHVAEQHALYQSGSINWLQLVQAIVAFVNTLVNPPAPAAPAS